MHRFRCEVVDELLLFYKQHNPLYASISVVNSSGLSADAVTDNLIVEVVDATVEIADIDAEQDRVGSMTDLDVLTTKADVVEHRVVFVADDREVMTQELYTVSGHPTLAAPEPRFLVRHSTQFAEKDRVLFARMWPHLFPYGRGHPGEERRVPVSFEVCIRHYSMLSSRRFAEDELFILASFDYLSVQKMYAQEESLLQALREKELQRQGCATPARGHDSSATAFLQTVELSGSLIWGSNGERAQCRRRAFAYQARFGQPALLVTLTPNVAESFVMAQYCGVTSVDTLFDAPLSAPPGRSTLHSAAMRNDVASARLFIRNIDAFIEHMLGVPLKHMKAKPFDGLFGPLRAYFGMVETQGGGTLHAHFLVWLENAPPNSEAFDRAVAVHGEEYYRDIEAFTDSVVSTSMPLNVANSSCVFCRHSYADLQQLPIPPEAYEDPNKQRDRLRGEQFLVQCAGCGTELSSQHVIRRMLLDSRPALWPALMRPYASDELKAAVRLETRCRGGTAAAKTAIYHRDLHLLGAADSSRSDVYGEYLRDLNHAPSRLERREDDAFRNADVTRALMMLPPSVDDNRFTPRVVAFVVSVLVFMFNLHWWSHAGSCFKKSRAPTPGQCRYRFPRDRAAHTSCSSDGVTVARQPPFEFINGYNREMMLAFKCNHDIQVMVGGLAALLRIYYATKYVTKMQEHVDSITAVALAAFQRRQRREARNEEAASSNRAATGRKRVASLLYAITNRCEIAGPLAVL